MNKDVIWKSKYYPGGNLLFFNLCTASCKNFLIRYMYTLSTIAWTTQSITFYFLELTTKYQKAPLDSHVDTATSFKWADLSWPSDLL